MVELSPCDAGFGARGAAPRTDPVAFHSREVDHQPAVADGAAGGVVAAAPHCHQNLVRAGEVDGIDDVGHSLAAGDQCGPPVDHAVPDPASILVAGLARAEQRTLQRRFEVVDNGFLQNGAHQVGTPNFDHLLIGHDGPPLPALSGRAAGYSNPSNYATRSPAPRRAVGGAAVASCVLVARAADGPHG